MTAPASAAPHVPAMGWWAAMGAAAGAIRGRPSLVAVGLLGFLARGGLVIFLLPIVALPTAIGISTFLGGTAITGAGASDGLVRLLVVAVVLVIALIVTGAVLGTLADILLGREAVALNATYGRGLVSAHGLASADREAAARTPIARSLVWRLLVVRGITLLPVAIAAIWGTARLVSAGYHQLTVPNDVSGPLAVRILLEASDAAIAVVAVWLAAEFVGGVAVRHVVAEGRSAPAAIGAAVAGIVRRPVTSVVTYLLGVFGVALIALPTLLVAGVLWSRLQAVLADGIAPLLILPATCIFVTVWFAGLGGVGIVAAWRSVAGTLDVLRAAAAEPASHVAEAPATLSTPAPSEVALQEC